MLLLLNGISRLVELGRELFLCSLAERLLEEATGLLAVGSGKSFGLDARFAFRADGDFDDLDVEYGTHNAMLGVRYSF